MDGIELGKIPNSSHTFNDGIRSIDYVLVWHVKSNDATSDKAYEQRRIFESNLRSEGLQLEHEAHDEHDLHFVKIHVPFAVIRRFSEVLKIRMPLKVSSNDIEKDDSKNLMTSCCDFILSKFRLDETIFPKGKHKLTATYSIDKEQLFDTTSEFKSPLVRFRIIQFLLDQKKFDNDDLAFGISRLLSNGTYSAAYPLHDGDLETFGSMRHLLNTHWASLTKCLKFQPLDQIKDYFGIKIGLYFAWLGFYTIMLIPASIVGLLCVLYSMFTISSYKPSEEICNYNSSIKMCPECDSCDYWDLSRICFKSRIAYFVDNPTTVFFTVFMSLWAVCFLELWKRYSAEMSYRWDLTSFDLYEEHPRPQFMAKKRSFKKQRNVITGLEEPVVPFWKVRVPVTIMSHSIMILLLLVVVATALGIIFYKISIRGAIYLYSGESKIPMDTKMFISITASVISLVFIVIFGSVYQWIAKWLTEKELLRTQKEFEDSLTLKIFILQLVNYYASICYIAFFRGKFVGRPGEYVRPFFGLRLEECPPGGCLLELSIQLAIIMIGKQFSGAIKEMIKPFLTVWWRALRTLGKENNRKSQLQCVQDYKLLDIGDMGLFPEYLEMVIQFGFITIFVSAFPLAPLFALLNNVLEVRLDAKKFVRYYRRTVLQRVKDIGVWYRILDSIGKLSIITNGLIIAFTSEFIPRLLYKLKNGDLSNYVEFTLDKFNTSVLEYPSMHSTYDQLQCSYPNYSYYEPYNDLERDRWYWQVMSARLFFVLVFENVVAVVMIFIRWAIPDVPRGLRNRIRREAYVTKNLILHQGRSGRHE